MHVDVASPPIHLLPREEGDRLISDTPFVMRDGAWHVFEPPEAVRMLFENAKRRFAASHWQDYKAVLEKDLQTRGEYVFVASLTVYEDERTKAYWSNRQPPVQSEVDP